MATLKEMVIAAVISGQYTNLELNIILNHDFTSLSDGLIDKLITKKEIQRAKELIATMDADDGLYTDSEYYQTMEDIEDMRNAWREKMKQEENSHNNISSNEHPIANIQTSNNDTLSNNEQTIKKEPSSKKQKSTGKKSKKTRNNSEENKEKLRANAAKARAAKQKKAEARKEIK